MPRGGARQGRPGVNYPNRNDMQMAPRALPVTAAPNQEYGEAGAQRAAQQVVPMASGPLMSQPDALSQLQQFNPPPVPGMADPTAMPDQHVMTGVDTPTPQPPSPLLKGVALLNALGANASPEVKAVRAALMAQQSNEAAP